MASGSVEGDDSAALFGVGQGGRKEDGLGSHFGKVALVWYTVGVPVEWLVFNGAESASSAPFLRQPACVAPFWCVGHSPRLNFCTLNFI